MSTDSDPTPKSQSSAAPVSVGAQLMCAWPLLLVAVGGAIGGALGGLAYGVNLGIYKSTMPTVLKVVLNVVTGLTAIILWMVIAFAINAYLVMPNAR